MVAYSEEMQTTGKTLVVAQAVLRKKVQGDIGEAAVDSPERTTFHTALAAFKEALYAANPEMRPAPAGDARGPVKEMDQLSIRSVHRFLQDIAVAEYGKAYAPNAPRPFNEIVGAIDRR